MAAADDAEALHYFLALLKKYADLLVRQRRGPRLDATEDKRRIQLHNELLYEVEHVRNLVGNVVSVRPVQLWEGDANPFDAMFDHHETIADTAQLIMRAIGVYRRNAKKEAEQVPASPPPSASTITVAREGVFFAGQPFDAMRAISSILATATKTIALVDAYIGPTTLDILTARPAGVTVDVVTHDKPRQTTTPALKALAEAWNKQHGGGLSIRLSPAFHDRFIVIDGADLYHLGTSIKDAAVKGGFMFSRIEEPTVLTALRDKLAAEWPTYAVFV